MHTILIATNTGLVTAQHTGSEWQVAHDGIKECNVTSVIAREGVILAGTRDGVLRSDDLGQSWQKASHGLSVRHVRWMAFHPDMSDLEFVGTEPAGIFVSHNGGESWRQCQEVVELRDTHRWWLPYSPEAGCVRGFAVQGTRAYAAVEVGGLLRSDDGGESWRLAKGSSGEPTFGDPPPGFIHPDVHSVQVHPSSPDLVIAPTNAGLYRSKDGGSTWDNIFPEHYCRAVWLDPTDAEHLILGPANSVDRGGQVVETRDGGETWYTSAEGLDTPWPRTMVERFTQVGDELLAVLSNGHLFAGPLVALEWRRILAEASGANAIAQVHP